MRNELTDRPPPDEMAKRLDELGLRKLPNGTLARRKTRPKSKKAKKEC